MDPFETPNLTLEEWYGGIIGSSLVRKRLPLGPYGSICLGSHGGPRGGGHFLMGAVHVHVAIYRRIGRPGTEGTFNSSQEHPLDATTSLCTPFRSFRFFELPT